MTVSYFYAFCHKTLYDYDRIISVSHQISAVASCSGREQESSEKSLGPLTTCLNLLHEPNIQTRNKGQEGSPQAMYIYTGDLEVLDLLMVAHCCQCRARQVVYLLHSHLPCFT